MDIRSIILLLEEKKSRDDALVDEQLVMANALKLMMKKKYKDVIALLEPIYKQTQENCKLSVLELLGFSYMETRQYDAAYRIWKIIYLAERDKLDTKNKSFPENMDHVGLIIKALTNMVACAKDAALTDHFVKQVLDYIDTYLSDFSKTTAVVDALYSLYLNAGMKTNDEADSAVDFAAQKRLTEKAKMYYEKALSCHKNDLTCLLYLARLLITRLQSPRAAIEFLLPYEDQFYNDPNYQYARYKLYDAIGCHDLAENHFRAYEKHLIPGRNDLMIGIFAELMGPSKPVKQISIDNAIIKLNNEEYDDAREIVHELLSLEPNNYCALELSARLEKSSGNIEESLKVCEKVLEINPESSVGLTIKASCLWMLGSEKLKEEAILYCERAYQLGCRSKELFSMLTHFYHDHDDQKKFLTYALSYANTTPSASLYYLIGLAYYRLSQFHLAKEAFIKVRALDNNFKTEQTFLGVIFSLFMLSTSKDQYKVCAEKISSYFSCLDARAPDPAIIQIVKELNRMGIKVPNSDGKLEEFEKQMEESKADKNNYNVLVPSDIKDKIIEAMKKSSFARPVNMKKPVDHASSQAKLEVNPENLVSLGKYGKIKGYIDPNADLSAEDRAKCQQALESGRLLSPGSRGISGVKTSYKDLSKFKIKIIGRLRIWGESQCVVGPNGENITVVNFRNIDRSHRKKG